MEDESQSGGTGDWGHVLRFIFLCNTSELNVSSNPLHFITSTNGQYKTHTPGLVKGAKLSLNPYFFGWLEK